MTATTGSVQLLPLNLRRIGVMVKAPKGNTDTVFFNFIDGAPASITGGMPLEPGEAIFFGTEFPGIMAAEYNGPITMIANTGAQNIRFIEF